MLHVLEAIRIGRFNSSFNGLAARTGIADYQIIQNLFEGPRDWTNGIKGTESLDDFSGLEGFLREGRTRQNPIFTDVFFQLGFFRGGRFFRLLNQCDCSRYFLVGSKELGAQYISQLSVGTAHFIESIPLIGRKRRKGKPRHEQERKEEETQFHQIGPKNHRPNQESYSTQRPVSRPEETSQKTVRPDPRTLRRCKLS